MHDEELSEFIQNQLVRFAEPIKAPSPPLKREGDRIWEPNGRSEAPCKVEWVRPQLADLFPGVPTRLPGRSPRSWTRGWQTRTPSPKAARVVRGASSLEGRHVLDADFDLDVADLCEQPMGLRLYDGRQHKPDFFMWMRSGGYEIREIKPEENACLAEDRWDAIGRGVAALGMTYRVVTETRLHHPPRLANVNLFMAARHVEPPSENILSSIWATLSAGPRSVDELMQTHPGLTHHQIYSLLRKGFVSMANLDHPFAGDAMLVRTRRVIRRSAASFRTDCATGAGGSA